MKPSAQIAEHYKSTRGVVMAEIARQGGLSEEQFAELVEKGGPQSEQHVHVLTMVVCLQAVLDLEHDRRQQWERGIEERLGKVARPICPLCLEPIARGQGHNVGANGVPMHNNCPE